MTGGDPINNGTMAELFLCIYKQLFGKIKDVGLYWQTKKSGERLNKDIQYKCATQGCLIAL
jgi:hypothetical protein